VKRSNPSSATVPAPAQWPQGKRPPEFRFLFEKRRAWIMGVLNATPDSFYAGARSPALPNALTHAEILIQEGADLLDIGGESTRPGAVEVPLAEELERVLPLIDALHQRWPGVFLSVDTQKADVARQALEHGAGLVNDVSSLRRDPAMADVIAQFDAPVVLMHMQGTPQDMQIRPQYGDVVDDVKSFFEERLAHASRCGIHEERVILDPGIGFGKTLEHNLSLLSRLNEFLVFGRPLLVGVSRKSFLGRLTGSSTVLPPEERLEGSLAAALCAVQRGASGLRVHDVQATRRALAVWQAVQA
jgi:dihydropteroate synthase